MEPTKNLARTEEAHNIPQDLRLLGESGQIIDNLSQAGEDVSQFGIPIPPARYESLKATACGSE